MKSPVLFCCFLIIFFNLQPTAAQLRIEKLSFTEALKKAEADGKILMVVMDSKSNKQQNKTTSDALRNQIAFTIDKQAVVIRPEVSGSDWNDLVRSYYDMAPYNNDPVGGLFFNPRGKLVHRYFFASNDPHAYFNQAFLAKRISDLPDENMVFDSLRLSGFSNTELWNQLIITRRELSKTTDDLLEQLISLTPVDSFRSFRYFEVLARLCPVIHTKADSIMMNSNFNINWDMLAANERVDIFRTINTKTFDKAIATKDYGLAGYLIDSVENNGTVNAEEKDKPFLRKGLMTNYYHLVKDTAAYILSAIDYADNYLMRLSVDSIDKAFKKNIEAMRKEGQPFITKPRGVAGMYASQLNFHAWQFYKMTRDPNLLQKALSWIKRAVDINATPEALGVYALLLYDTGNRTEAIRHQKTLISSLKNLNSDNELIKAERILARMKMDSEKVDE